MLIKTLHRSGLVFIAFAFVFVGCLRTGTKAELGQLESSRTTSAQGENIGQDSPTELANESTAPTDSLGTNSSLLAIEHFEDEVFRLFTEAEQYYALGVLANQDAEWEDAQYNFENATAVLANIDLANVEQSDFADRFDILLREIAFDYQFTLASMGGLTSESSMAAFLLRFESLENVRDYHETEPPPEADPEQVVVTYNVPIELNEKVKSCLVYFQTVARKPFKTYLKRSGRYIPLMAEIIAEYDLPSDLVYLPLIESGFNPKAYSYAHASGPWQFISTTGRQYDLNRSWWQDERRDFVKSTHAACKYLKYLYEMFDSWQLALASYNGGEGRVGRQIKRQKTRDFWELRLRKQTRNYVPLYMAATMIAKEPERFGFGGIEYDEPLDFDVVRTEKAIDLKAVAHHLKISLADLKMLNPELLRGVTPPGEGFYQLRVPRGYQAKFSTVYPRIPESKSAQWTRHRVRKGETISTIARKYGVSQRAVVDANKLRSRHRIYIGQVLTVPVPTAPSPMRARSKHRAVSSNGKYFVKRGDTLWELAAAFNTTIPAIRRANGMRSRDQLIAGREIVIPGKSAPTGGKSVWYTIKAGDTLSEIADHFGVRIRDILAVNKLSNPRRIHAGTKIRIP